MNGVTGNRLPVALRLGAPLVATAVLAAACSSGSSSSGGAYGAKSSTTSSGAASAAAVTVQTRSGADGRYLTDGSGRALYLWVADKSAKSTCTGPCAAVWPPLVASGTPKAGDGADAAELGTSRRGDGTMQVTYHGHPLYYFAQDERAGQTTGQGNTGFGAAWWLVAPSGTAITPGSSGGSGGSGASGGTAPGYTPYG